MARQRRWVQSMRGSVTHGGKFLRTGIRAHRSGRTSGPAARLGLILLVASGASGAGCGGESDRSGPAGRGAAASAPLNVLLITLDTTRADALGCYGQPLAASPQIDRLATEGVRFDQVVTSAPSTLPAHASILTGKQPYAHGVRSNMGYVLAAGNETLAEALGRHGYQTAAEIAAPVIGSRTQLDQGFDHYRDLDAYDVVRKFATIPGPTGPEPLEFIERAADDITRRGLEFLRAGHDRPFFLWLHYFDAHQSYLPPQLYLQQVPESPYHAEIRFIDHNVGRIASELVRLGLRDQTLVVITADHGEGLGEHGEHSHSFFVYDGTMRVPLIFWGADAVPRGRVVTSLVRTIDIAPTILDLVGVPPLAEAQGVSLRALLAGDRSDLALTGYGESIEFRTTFGSAILRFVRDGDWKYIHKVEPELFDVRADPGERDNLASRHPEVVDQLRSRLHLLIAEAPPRPEGAEVPIDRETLAQLAALGYAGATTVVPIEDEAATLTLAGADPVSLTDAIVRMSRAQGDMKLRRYDSAAKAFGGLWKEHPESTAVLYGLIRALLGLDRDDQAIPLLRRGIQLDPGFGDFYFLLGSRLRAKGEVAEAGPVLREAVDLEPCRLGPRVELANLLAAEQRYAEQFALLDAGISRCQGEVREGFRNDYAYALATCHEERFRDGARAVKIAREIIEAEGGTQPNYLDTLAAAHAEVGEFDQAIETSRRAIAILRNREISDQVIASFESNLERYEAGQPVREP